MFEELKRPLKQGDSFSGVLTFEKAGPVNVTFVVEAMGAAAPAVDDHAHAGGDR